MGYSPNYQTRDLSLAAAIVTLGYEVIDLDQYQGRAFTFITNVDYSTGKDLESRYYKNKLEVPAKAFTDSVKGLKRRVEQRALQIGL